MLTITGAGNHLIVIDGDIYDEFETSNCRKGRIALSDGALLSVKFDKFGGWRLTPIVKGSLYDHKEDGTADDGTNDVVYFKRGINWVLFAKESQESKAIYKEDEIL